MKIAIVIRQPDGQIVQLPRDVHLEGDEVFAKHVGQSVVLVPKRTSPWQSLIDSLDKFSDDYMESRRG